MRWLPNVLRAVVLLALAGSLVAGCATTPAHAVPTCRLDGESDVLTLMAQAVPSATRIPCIREFPVGWSFGGQRIQSGRADFWLFSDRAGEVAVTVSLTSSCDVSQAVEVPTEADEAGMGRFEEPEALPPSFRGNRYYVFPGGCVTYRFAFGERASFALAVEATEALSFFPRSVWVEALRERGMILCGAGVKCPG